MLSAATCWLILIYHQTQTLGSDRVIHPSIAPCSRRWVIEEELGCPPETQCLQCRGAVGEFSLIIDKSEKNGIYDELLPKQSGGSQVLKNKLAINHSARIFIITFPDCRWDEI